MTVATDILFVHANFPGQYKLLAHRLAQSSRFRVFAIGSNTATDLEGVTLQRYRLPRGELDSIHAYGRRFELECRRAEQVTYAANMLKLSGMSPKVVFVHPGWGEALPLRQIFPEARICVYCEFYYRPEGADVGFDREFDQFGVDGLTRLHLKNAATLLALVNADAAIAPTSWQRGLYPAEFHSKIRVIHDGIDTIALKPGRSTFTHPQLPHTLTSGDEVLTFVARNLEPYRGFHVFMRALPQILQSRPNVQVCVAGGFDVSYGSPPANAQSWKDALVDEIRDRVDLSRVHFLGSLAYDQYVSLLRVSRTHVYLTYPFVLSWSILEALALECLVVASDTAPVSEVIRHGENGLLVPFFQPEILARRVSESLASPEKFLDIRKRARATVLKRYSFDSQSLPQFLRLTDELLATRSRPTSSTEDPQTNNILKTEPNSSGSDSTAVYSFKAAQAAVAELRKY
jgi:glycosyltransferase involved in cell wall biosynthesis